MLAEVERGLGAMSISPAPRRMQFATSPLDSPAQLSTPPSPPSTPPPPPPETPPALPPLETPPPPPPGSPMIASPLYTYSPMMDSPVRAYSGQLGVQPRPAAAPAPAQSSGNFSFSRAQSLPSPKKEFSFGAPPGDAAWAGWEPGPPALEQHVPGLEQRPAHMMAARANTFSGRLPDVMSWDVKPAAEDLPAPQLPRAQPPQVQKLKTQSLKP